jgi:hypothetical protein
MWGSPALRGISACRFLSFVGPASCRSGRRNRGIRRGRSASLPYLEASSPMGTVAKKKNVPFLLRWHWMHNPAPVIATPLKNGGSNLYSTRGRNKSCDCHPAKRGTKAPRNDAVLEAAKDMLWMSPFRALIATLGDVHIFCRLTTIPPKAPSCFRGTLPRAWSWFFDRMRLQSRHFRGIDSPASRT